MNETAEITEPGSRPNFSASAETRLLYARLRKLAVGEIVSYAVLSEIVGVDVQAIGRGALNSARRIAERDDAIVTDAIHNKGIKRLSAAETVHSSGRTFGRIRRLAQRSARRLVGVDYDALSDPDKAQRNASLSALAVVKLMGKPKSVEKIAAANASSDELPLARTLELFRGPRSV